MHSSFDLSHVQAVSTSTHQLENNKTRQPYEVHPVSCSLCVGPQVMCVTTPVACHQEPAGAANVEICSARKASLGFEGLKADE